MNFELTEELLAVRDLSKKIAEEEVAGRAREIDRQARYPIEIFEVYRQTGLLGLCIPVEYGGAGMGTMGLTLAIEEVAKYSSAAALMLLLTRLASGPILIAGTESQKQKYLAGIANGSLKGSFALSEVQAGSDVKGILTNAKPVGADSSTWVINGRKCWISGISQADFFVVFAKTLDKNDATRASISCFIVDRDTDGLSIGSVDRKLGVKGVDTGELILDDVVVDQDAMLGEVGGFKLAMLALNSMRPIVAARGIGLAEGCIAYAVDYMKTRRAFNRSISEFQGLRWEIAKLVTELEAARLLTYRAAFLIDEGHFTKEYVPYLSMSKYYATEMAVRASSLSLQVMGAAGYMEDHPLELYYRDAKQLTIVEGTSQIQLDLIARGVFDGDISW